MDTRDGAELVGKQPSAGVSYAGIVIPYFWPGSRRPFNLRLRRDKPDVESNGDGTTKEKGKYLAQPGARNCFYIPPTTTAEWLTDASIPVAVTEGEKKALALYRFNSERGEKVLVIALSGVWNFRGKLGVERDARGHVFAEVKGIIPDFDKVTWKGRRALIVFDANVSDNESVNAARAALAKELHRRSADVFIVDLPAAHRVNGIDDLLGLKGPEFVADVLNGAQAFYPTFPLTDVGNSERLVHFEHHRIRYSYRAKEWFIFDGARWRNDDQSIIERLAKQTARRIYVEAANELDKDNQEEIVKFAGKCQTRQKVESMLWLARSEVAREIDQFDLNPHLLNLTNGTLDLATGKLDRHSADDYLSKITSGAFDEKATCPEWLAFLDRIFDKNQALISYVRKAVGYTLTGDISEQCLFICYGSGANGKTVFLRTISGMLGHYAMAMPVDSLMITRQSSGPREDITRLRGARLVVASEAEDGQRFAESLIKQLTGGDTITARFLFANSFEFQPEFKIWLGVNHKPAVRGTDEGIWRRLRLIPFSVTIPKEERKPLKEMLDTMRAEWPGILNWALEGLRPKDREGFKSPEEVSTATNEYREEMDVIGRFLAEHYEPKKSGKTGTTAIYRHFKAWAEEKNEYVMTQTAFSRKLGEGRHGVFELKKGKDGDGLMVWFGLELIGR